MKIFEILMLIIGVMIIVLFVPVCEGWFEKLFIIFIGVVIGIGIPEFIKIIWKKYFKKQK